MSFEDDLKDVGDSIGKLVDNAVNSQEFSGIKPEDFRHHQPVCLPKPEGTIPCKWHTGAVPRLFRRYFLQQPAFFP